MYNLCMKELLIVVSIVTIRLNEKANFSNICNICMKELFIFVTFVTISFSAMTNLSMKELVKVVFIVI